MDNIKLKKDAEYIIKNSIAEMLPERAVKNALSGFIFNGPVHMVAIGKAAYRMAEAACDHLGERIVSGLVVTKYGHAGASDRFKIIEAGHPVPDLNSVAAASAALEIVNPLGRGDAVLLLISGGGSALFEMPADGLTLGDVGRVTDRLLSCGADITEINAIRKKLSVVKGGGFAAAAYPAKVYSVILSDVLTDDPATIASGPACPDTGGVDASGVIKKYGLTFDKKITERLETKINVGPVDVVNVICGSVREFCASAAKHAERLGYETQILTTSLGCEAREAGRFLGAIGRYIRRANNNNPRAVIAGGETTVTLKGAGLGGRNQELALAAADEIAGLSGIIIFSFGSDGTDGPTDAAGGIVDGGTKKNLAERGLILSDILADNDSYNGLKACGGLIVTGPTGTNVNDVSVILCG